MKSVTEKVLTGYNIRSYPNIDIEICKERCMNATNFVCRLLIFFFLSLCFFITRTL